MIMQKFIKDRASALKVADSLSLANIILIILLSFTTYHAITNKVILQVVPPHLDERVAIAYNAVSESYHIKYAQYSAIMMGNVTPSSVLTTIEALQHTFSPELYHRVKADLQRQGEQMSQGGSTLEFLPKTWEYEPDTGLTFITGKQTLRPLNGTPVSKSVTYEFAIEVNNYVPWIKHFALYSGVAHNKIWRDEHSGS